MSDLVAHIRQLNAETQAWVDAVEGRWAGLLTEDPEHWAAMGIYTVAQFDAYIDACHEREREKMMFSDYACDQEEANRYAEEMQRWEEEELAKREEKKEFEVYRVFANYQDGWI